MSRAFVDPYLRSYTLIIIVKTRAGVILSRLAARHFDYIALLNFKCALLRHRSRRSFIGLLRYVCDRPVLLLPSRPYISPSYDSFLPTTYHHFLLLFFTPAHVFARFDRLRTNQLLATEKKEYRRSQVIGHTPFVTRLYPTPGKSSGTRPLAVKRKGRRLPCPFSHVSRSGTRL